MIRSYISFKKDCGIVLKLKLKRFFSQSFGLDSLIGLGYLSLMFSLRANA